MSGQVPVLEQSEAEHKEEAGREQYALAEALCDTAAALNSTLKLEEVLERILANAGRVVPHDAANVMLIESGVAQIIVRSRGYSERGPSGEEVLALRLSVADMSSLSRMAETGQPVAIPDTQDDPRWVVLPETQWVRSCVGAPICLERKVVGFLNLDSATPGFFTPVHAERLRVFADQAAVAIRNARLYESELHRRQIAEMLLETSAAVASSLDLGRVLLTLAGRLLDISGFHICAISEWDREAGQTRALAERARAIWTPGGGEAYRLSNYPTIEQVLTTDEPRVVHVGMPDADEAELALMREQGFRALSMLPLCAGDETIGLVEIGSSQSELAFDQTTALHCRPILQDAASRLASPLRANSDAALLALAVQLAAASGGSSCAILTWQQMEGEVRTAVKYSDSIWSPGEGPACSLTDRPGLAYALKRNSSIVAQLSDLSSPISRGILAKRGARTLVIQPLSTKGEPIGLIELYDVAEEQIVNDDELRLWRAVADQAAVAIKNAQLYEAERRERVLAQTLQETAEAMASSVHLGNTLSLIIEQLSRVLDYDHAMIMLIEDDRLRVVAAGGLPDQDQVLGTDYHYPDIPLFHEVMSTGKPLVLPDAQKALRWTQLPGTGASIRGWIGVPLIAWDAVIGFLSIGSNQPDAYSARDAEAVTAFAQQAAVAVENARILTELEASLSDLRQAQAHLMRTARLSAAGEVAAGVAHQINNPLTAVIAESHLLLKRLAPDSPEHESVVAIRQAAHRAGSVAQRLLDLSRPRPFEMHPLDVNLSIQSTISLLAAQIEPNIARLVVDLAPGLPMIEGSEEHLGEVWINLLINARDAVGKAGDGVIKVTTGLDVNGDAIEVTVQDNGPGISAGYIERVFDPFFTTKVQGTGLGLSICHDIVTRHGGSIRVESEEGQGAIFTVTLPLNKPV